MMYSSCINKTSTGFRWWAGFDCYHSPLGCTGSSLIQTPSKRFNLACFLPKKKKEEKEEKEKEKQALHV